MKILMMSDLHLRDSGSRYRVDDFREAQFKKLEWCLQLAVKNNCDCFLQAGDWFDSVRASNQLISDTISLLNKYNIDVYAVSGNHDQRYRDNSLTNTPIKVLESAGVIKLLSGSPLDEGNVNIYGCHWGDEIPEIVDEAKFNALIIHKMIIQNEDEKIWYGQTGYATSRMMLAKNKFDVILSGDNHKSFIDEYQGRLLFNLGSLTRLNVSQLNHSPQIVLFDTDAKTYELFKVPIEPPENVFNLEEVEKAKKHKDENGKIKDYIDVLSQDAETREWNFVSNLEEFVKSNGIKESVAKIIKSTLVEN